MLDLTHKRLPELALLTILVFASSASAQPAQPAEPASINGVYNGSYTGDNGLVKCKLMLTRVRNGTIGGACTLYVADGADTKEYTCEVRGQYIAANRMVIVIRGKWETAPPAGIDMP